MFRQIHIEILFVVVVVVVVSPKDIKENSSVKEIPLLSWESTTGNGTKRCMKLMS